MSVATYSAFIFTVALLVATAYFLMGGLPLLILKHDVPLDAKFIRSFFNVYYRAAFWIALAAGLSYAAWGKHAFAVAAVAIALLCLLLRRVLLSAMTRLGVDIHAGDAAAIGQFRRLHATALWVNLTQLVVIVWGLLKLARQLS